MKLQMLWVNYLVGMEIINKMILKNKLVFNSLILIVSIISLFLLLGSSDRYIKSVNIGGQNVKVELALTPEIQEKGLSDRVSLASGTGMLFVFPKPSEYYFWMKGMNFKIDIIWIDAEMNVVYIKDNADFKDFMSTYGSEVQSKYVLEVNAGFSEKYDLKVGDRIQFTY